ncbi:IKI3 family protein [Peziza echinospora]|nr:IKI3 family protein [Peziza echinospora]
MRNLLITQREAAPASSTEVPDLPLTATAWDPATDSLICTFGPSESEAVIELKRLRKQGQFDNITSFDVPCEIPTLAFDRVLSLHYFGDSSSICIVFAGGNIVVVEVDEDFQSKGVEIVGSVDEGITAAAWSPDEEVLAITTSLSTFLLMTRNFESIATTTFTAADLSASNHVSVGWGKKETQFKGKRAHAMRDPTVPEKVDEGVLSPEDDQSVRISWRGDGAFLTISKVDDEKRRLLRVYTREGVLDSVSEPVDGLEGPLSWRPSGNLISTIQRFSDRRDVIFFERNGLRHGEFSISIPQNSVGTQKINQLAWNADSSVLAISLTDRVQFWTMGNYHYYLKEEIIYNHKGVTIAAAVVEWHPEKALKFAITLPDEVLSYEFVWTVHRGTTNVPNDLGLVGVIDGANLKITPIRNANVPPPMALYDIALESTPIDLAMSSSGNLIAVLRHTSVDIIQWYPGKPRTAKKPQLTSNVARFELEDNVRQIEFVSPTRIAVLSDTQDSCVLKYFDVDAVSSTEAGEDVLPVDTTNIIPDGSGASGELYYVEAYRRVHSINGKGDVFEFPVPCHWVEVILIGDKENYFGLSDSGRLYANSTLIASNCTSFIVTESHLIYTTTQHLLKFVHLHTGEKGYEIPADDPTGDERCRSIERGGKIIHVMPTTFSLTYQVLPRGNLETIFPRALVVAGVRRSIEAKDYKTAFLACRSQRVDLNILHDHAPEQFLANIPLVIDQLKKIEYIDLFLSQLREEDVSKTMYRETLPQTDGASVIPAAPSAPAGSLPADSKVNRICKGFLDALFPSRLSKNLQNIVTAHVCKSPPDHDAALQLIGKLREENMDLAEQAIIHVCFLADPNRLYNNALGLYDLDLTLMVAQQSQKDPREYLPFLQGLEELEIVRRKFSIDDHLGRHAKALASLVELVIRGEGGDGDVIFEEELKAYVEKHELYREALEGFKYKPDQQRIIMHMYAEYLDEHSRFKEAGLAYESINLLSPAVESYRRAGMWEHSLSCATLIPLPSPDLQNLANNLIDVLSQEKDYLACAQIHQQYRNDIPSAVRSLCKGSHFVEAMRLCGLYSPPTTPTTTTTSTPQDLLTEIVDPGLVDAFGTLVELFSDCRAQVKAQMGRLRELREKKELDPLSYFEGIGQGAGGGPDGIDIPDNISVAATDATTSAGTFLTRYTGKTGGTAGTSATRRTSKNKKREDRKRARGKKGTIYEEEYLVNSMQRLVERIESVKPETGRLVEGMVRRGMRERAGAVQGGMVEMVGILRGGVEEVFSDKSAVNLFLYGTGAEEGEEGAEGAGGGVLAGKKVPVVEDFQTLALL